MATTCLARMKSLMWSACLGLGMLGCSVAALAQEPAVPLLGEGGQVQAPVAPAPRVAWLGVALANRTVDSQPAVFITHVHPGGPADRAGLKVGDRVLRLGDADVASRAGIIDALAAREPGAVVTVSVERDGAQQAFDVTLGNRSDYIRDATVCTHDDDDLLDDDFDAAADHELIEQNQRLTQMIEQLQREINTLRDEVQALRAQATSTPDQALPAPSGANPTP